MLLDQYILPPNRTLVAFLFSGLYHDTNPTRILPSPTLATFNDGDRPELPCSTHHSLKGSPHTTRSTLTSQRRRPKKRQEDGNKTSSSTPVPSSTKKSATVKNLPSTARGKMGPQQTSVRQLPTLGPQSCIAFFVNGECISARYMAPTPCSEPP